MRLLELMVRAGALQPDERIPLSDLERWYWPRTDGGAHDERAATEAFARLVGMIHQEPVMPILGEFIAWATVPKSEWLALSPEQRSARAEALAKEMTGQQASRLRQPWPGVERELSVANTAGTPREWAALMARVLSGDGLPPAVVAVVRRHLEWPLVAFASNCEQYEPFVDDLTTPFKTCSRPIRKRSCGGRDQ